MEQAKRPYSFFTHIKPYYTTETASSFYCSEYANLRRKNTGADEPHNVTYWGLGNEIWGEWQVNYSLFNSPVSWRLTVLRLDFAGGSANGI